MGLEMSQEVHQFERLNQNVAAVQVGDFPAPFHVFNLLNQQTQASSKKGMVSENHSNFRFRHHKVKG